MSRIKHYLFSRVTQAKQQDGIPEKNNAALQDTDHCYRSSHRHHYGGNAPDHAGVLVCCCLSYGGSIACSHHHVAKVPN